MIRNVLVALAFCGSIPAAQAFVAQDDGSGVRAERQVVRPVPLQDRVAEARQGLVEAILANDADARVKLYRPDAISMPEHQPALVGAGAIARYHQALQSRVRMTHYVPQPIELFELGGTLLEIGTFDAAWSTPKGKADARRGKYAHVWAVEPDGRLRLKADVWGYFEPLPDPSLFFVAMPEKAPIAPASAAGDARTAETLRRLNAADATAVRTRDVDAKLALLSDDAVIYPFADRPRSGMAEIRPYLTEYTAGGAGITFDDVRVWSIGFEAHGDYILEYAKFHVDWRWPDSKGITKGGGLRLWKRQPDGSLKRLRQIGTHDHVQ